MDITHRLSAQHRMCDTHFAKAEKAMQEGNLQEARYHFDTFKGETLFHFTNEEEVLFPAFESATGITQGPTQVMRMEHAQIKSLIDKLDQAVTENDKEAFFSMAESMMILLQQHNMKEEQMLYPMCDKQLPEDLKAQTLETIAKSTP